MLQGNAFLNKYILINCSYSRGLNLVFHNLGAATWNDLSPRVFLVLTSGHFNDSSLLKSRLYRVRYLILIKLQIGWCNSIICLKT